MKKNVLITGAGSGIGFATAKRFAQEGYIVIALGRKTRELQQLREAIGNEHHFILFDVTQLHKIPKLISSLEKKTGGIDILINNAGIGLFKKFEEISDSAIDKIVRTNLFAPMALSRAVFSSMKERGGTIVNIASVAGKRTWKHLTAYSASKFGLIGFSNSLRRECNYYNYPVKIVVVCPPAVDTPFFAHAGYPEYKRDHPGQSLLSADTVADEIYHAVIKNKREVVVGWRAKILDKAYALSPRFIEWLEDWVKKK
ncbi:MAG: hypothetical protein RL557_335 [archaeon]